MRARSGIAGRAAGAGAGGGDGGGAFCILWFVFCRTHPVVCFLPHASRQVVLVVVVVVGQQVRCPRRVRRPSREHGLSTQWLRFVRLGWCRAAFVRSHVQEATKTKSKKQSNKKQRQSNKKRDKATKSEIKQNNKNKKQKTSNKQQKISVAGVGPATAGS